MRLLRVSIALAALVFASVAGGALVRASGADAAAPLEPQHVFSASFKGQKHCEFTEPGGIAVNESTHEIFVYDRATNAVDRFSSTGQCLLHFKVGPSVEGEEGIEGIAVDNSPTSPSFGAVYAVDPGAGEPAIYKRDAEGNLLAKIKKFKKQEKEAEEFQFEEIHGLGTDANGGLWVYQGEVIDGFSNEEPNRLLTVHEAFEAAGECGVFKPGFAVDGKARAFYAGRGRENRAEPPGCDEHEETTVIAKLGAGAEALIRELDPEASTGAAVDGASGEAYVDNGSTIAAFNPEGYFAQRFGGAGEEGTAHLHESRAIAVDASTNEVLAVDAADTVERFTPVAAAPAPIVDSENAHPDGRAWEFVSPPDKHGAGIYAMGPIGGLEQAAENGSSIAYAATAPIVANPPSNRSPEATTTISRRGAGGWSFTDLASPRGQEPIGIASGKGSEYRIFSSDLSLGLVMPDLGLPVATEDPPLSPEASETTLYRRDTTLSEAECEAKPAACWEPLVTDKNVPPGTKFGTTLEVSGASPDMRHVVFSSSAGLVEGIGNGENLFAWESGAPLQVVNLLPPAEGGGPAPAAVLGGGAHSGNARNAVTDVGGHLRIIWSVLEGEGEQHLYLRDMSKGETLRIDRPLPGTPEPPNPTAKIEPPTVVFETASKDGTRVFFADSRKLTPGSTEEEEELPGEATAGVEGLGDLYVCEVVEDEAHKLACKLTDLTAELKNPHENAAVQGLVPGASADGSDVYFVADGVLAPGASRGSCNSTSGEETRNGTTCNLYVSRSEGGTWGKPRFIAALSKEDHPDWRSISEQFQILGTITSRVSPNGRYLAFMSKLPLTGYDNIDVHSGQRDEEVYLYDAEGAHLICASCDPSGEPPAGVHDVAESGEGNGLVVDQPGIWRRPAAPGPVEVEHWLAGSIPGWTPLEGENATYQSRYLADSGRLFFNSPVALAGGVDTNGKEDVYEYEPGGQGSCASPRGCIALTSSGTALQESAFLDASTSGEDLFFLTAGQLVEQDHDTAFDVYDAHVCSASSPCPPPPPPDPRRCQAEACPQAPTPPPAPPGAPASTVPTSGNHGKTSEPPHLSERELLERALKKCKKLKRKAKRRACERQARRRYPHVKLPTASKRRRGK